MMTTTKPKRHPVFLEGNERALPGAVLSYLLAVNLLRLSKDYLSPQRRAILEARVKMFTERSA